MENKRKCFLTIIIGAVICLLVSSKMIFLHETTALTSQEFEHQTQTQTPYQIPSENLDTVPSHTSSTSVNIREEIKPTTKERISKVAKLINNANKHVRGSKTSDYLKAAIKEMKRIVKDISVDEKGLFERTSVHSQSICPEYYTNGGFGFPFYNKGFKVDQCNYGIPISNLVTIVKFIDTKETSDHVEKFIASIYKTINDIKTLIAINSETVSVDVTRRYEHVSLLKSKYKNEGSALNNLIKQVKTPYVLIARNVDFFTNDLLLERMVRELESLKVVAVGGAFRYPNGHWHKGCFQTMYRNYVLKYISGYDESFHECLFCDYVQGPFLTSTKYLKSNVFGDFNENNGLFEDWFLKMLKKKEEASVCPDSMFHVKSKDDVKSDAMNGFLQKWEVSKMVTTEGKTINRPCTNKPSGRRTLLLSPCTASANVEAVNAIMQSCVKVNMTCELQEGTAIGAVKFGTALPYELDFDIRFSFENCSKCKILDQLFSKNKFKFDHFATDCCTKKIVLGEKLNYKVRVNGYQGDFTAHPILGSDELAIAGIEKTKVAYGGQWVNFAHNPGFYIRNRYGKGTYRHAEHYTASGIKGAHGRMDYFTERFNPCTSPGAHNCLDNYEADGSLSYRDLLP